MTRAEVISELSNILPQTPALKFAIESLKVDEAYNLMYEKVDFIEIPEGTTNGDMIKAVFPNISVYEHENGATYSINNEYNFNSTWWNSPYRKEQE